MIGYTVQRAAELLSGADDNTEIKFSPSGNTIVGVMHDLLGKCPPGAVIRGLYLTEAQESLCGLLVSLPGGKEASVYGRSRRMRGAMGRPASPSEKSKAP